MLDVMRRVEIIGSCAEDFDALMNELAQQLEVAVTGDDFAQIDRILASVPGDRELEAAVLRPAPLGDVEPAEDLDPRDEPRDEVAGH